MLVSGSFSLISGIILTDFVISYPESAQFYQAISCYSKSHALSIMSFRSFFM